MRITKLILKNFKSIGAQQTIELKPITLLFGPNSAGKSTVLQALAYLREILVSKNIEPDITELAGEAMDLGGFANLVHNHDLDNKMLIGVGMDLRHRRIDAHISASDEHLFEMKDLLNANDLLVDIETIAVVFEIEWNHFKNAPIISGYVVEANGQHLLTVKTTSDLRSAYISNFNFGHRLIYEDSHDAFLTIDDLQEIGISNEKDDSSRTDDLGILFTMLLDTTREDAYKPAPYHPFEVADCKLLTVESAKELETSLNSSQTSFNEIYEAGLRLMYAVFPSAFGEPEDPIDLAVNGYASKRYIYKLMWLAEKKMENRCAADYAYHFDIERNNIPFSNQALFGSLLPLGECLELDQSFWAEDQYILELCDNPLAYTMSIESIFSAAAIGPVELLAEKLEDLYYLGRLRQVPSRSLMPKKGLRRQRWATGIAAWEEMYDLSAAASESKVLDKINFWLSPERLNCGYQVKGLHYAEVRQDQPRGSVVKISGENIGASVRKTRLVLQGYSSDLEVMPSDVGVGISQVIPVVVCAVINDSAFIAVEQPELHIHPAIQVELGDLFIDGVERGNQFLLETHSEHLILRLLRRIREQSEGLAEESQSYKITPEEVGVIYVQPSEDGAKFIELKITKDGDFEEDWPKGFFNERDSELFF